MKMVHVFMLGAEVNHRVGDHTCPSCEENYPEPCRCGGLVHAVATGDEDADGNPVLVTACDACGLSEDQLGDL
jgi:hypothetical protein